MTPILGKTIYYQYQPKEFRAALITKVVSDTTANLHIFSSDSAPDQKLSDAPYGTEVGSFVYPNDTEALAIINKVEAE